MTVYVMGCQGNRLVKIGHTAGSAENRLAALATGSPYPLRIIWQSTADLGRDTEKALHRLFRDYRTHGEWFDFGEANPAILIATAAELPLLAAARAAGPAPALTIPAPTAQPLETPPEPPPPPSVPPRDLLEDMDVVMGDVTIGAPSVPVLLRNLAPDWPPYQRMTGKQLRAELARLGVKVPCTHNRYPINPAVIRAALAARSGSSSAA